MRCEADLPDGTRKNLLERSTEYGVLKSQSWCSHLGRKGKEHGGKEGPGGHCFVLGRLLLLGVSIQMVVVSED